MSSQPDSQAMIPAPPGEVQMNLPIDGIHCAGCVAAIEKALAAIDQMLRRYADIATRQAGDEFSEIVLPDAAVRVEADAAQLRQVLMNLVLNAAEAIGDRVETGTVFMNRCDYLDPALAWTGINDSGHGCTLSRVGYEQLTRPMSFHLRTKI